MSLADLLDPSRIEIKLAEYGVAPATALYDAALVLQAQDYRRNASSRMYPLDGQDIGQRIPTTKLHVSRKLDGEFTMLVYRHDHVVCLNPGGTVRCGLPWQEEAADRFRKAGITEALIVGELYVRHADGRRARVHDVVSLARNPRDVSELSQICFGMFDVVSWNESAPDVDFFSVFEQIQSTFDGADLVHAVPATIVQKSSEVEKLYRDWVEGEGAEGLVVRSESAGSFKVKPRHHLDVVVVGFTESTDDRQGMLHDLLVAVKRHDDTLQILGRVGGGFSDDERREFLSDLNDLVVASEYAEVNSDRVAYRMVAPEWVIEVSCLDLVAQTTRGGPVNRMALEYDPQGDPQYRVARRMPLAAVISPQFIRKRDDKQVTVGDVGIDQIAKRVDLPLAQQDARQLALPKS